VLAIAGEDVAAGNNLLLSAVPDGQTTWHITAALAKNAVTAASMPIVLRLSSPDYPPLVITDHFFAPEAAIHEAPQP